ncbi:hypothetical protein BSLG_005643 [Batrachochytrium salamandrivorans]|nr:hypothetical protein BSLG_005643 [Batrachochytrium salamandrivorans]
MAVSTKTLLLRTSKNKLNSHPHPVQLGGRFYRHQNLEPESTISAESPQLLKTPVNDHTETSVKNDTLTPVTLSAGSSKSSDSCIIEKQHEVSPDSQPLPAAKQETDSVDLLKNINTDAVTPLHETSFPTPLEEPLSTEQSLPVEQSPNSISSKISDKMDTNSVPSIGTSSLLIQNLPKLSRALLQKYLMYLRLSSAASKTSKYQSTTIKRSLESVSEDSEQSDFVKKSKSMEHDESVQSFSSSASGFIDGAQTNVDVDENVDSSAPLLETTTSHSDNQANVTAPFNPATLKLSDPKELSTTHVPVATSQLNTMASALQHSSYVAPSILTQIASQPEPETTDTGKGALDLQMSKYSSVAETSTTSQLKSGTSLSAPLAFDSSKPVLSWALPSGGPMKGSSIFRTPVKAASSFATELVANAQKKDFGSSHLPRLGSIKHTCGFTTHSGGCYYYKRHTSSTATVSNLALIQIKSNPIIEPVAATEVIAKKELIAKETHVQAAARMQQRSDDASAIPALVEHSLNKPFSITSKPLSGETAGKQKLPLSYSAQATLTGQLSDLEAPKTQVLRPLPTHQHHISQDQHKLLPQQKLQLLKQHGAKAVLKSNALNSVLVDAKAPSTTQASSWGKYFIWKGEKAATASTQNHVHTILGEDGELPEPPSDYSDSDDDSLTAATPRGGPKIATWASTPYIRQVVHVNNSVIQTIFWNSKDLSTGGDF